MTDTEWNAWQESWRGANGPLPAIGARTRTAGRRHRLDAVFGVVMIFLGLVISILLVKGQPHEKVIGWLDLAFVVAIAIGFIWIERGAKSYPLASPRDALAFLERRIRAERRGARFAPALYLCLLVAVTGYEAVGAIRASDGIGLVLAGAILVVGSAVTLAVPWLVRRRVDQQQAEVNRWRRWLDEQNL